MKNVKYNHVICLKCITAFLVTLAINFPVAAPAEKSPAEKFHEAMQYADTLRDTVHVREKKLLTGKVEFKPHEVFKEQKGGYSEEPSQSNYYHIQQNIRDMETAALQESSRDEVGKTVMTSFQTRPIFKLNEYIKKGSKESCEKAANKQCTETYVEKTCNEVVRTIKRVCTKTADVSVEVDETIYPNCQNMVVVRTFRGGCPGGYSQIVCSDMMKGPSDDDVSLCVKPVVNNESQECFVSYLVHGVHGNSHVRRTQGSGVGTIPKKMHGHMRFSNAYDGNMIVTIINETTGQTLHNAGSFANGQVIDLPFSETQDQTFRFYIANNHYRGVVVLYVDRINKQKVPKIDWLEKQEECRDI